MGIYGTKVTSAPTGAIILHPGDDISAIVNAAPAGATFYFEAGVYRGVSLAPKDGQTFIGAQGAILNGSAVLSSWTQSGNLWSIGGQTQQGRVNTGAEFVAGTQRPGNPETVFLDNTPLKPVDALSKVVPGTFYFDYAADKIYIADNPAGHTLEAGKQTDAFHGTATNVTVQNLVIEKYDPQIQDGAINGDRGWIIRDNEIRLNYAVGATAHDGSQFIGNYVHDNGQMGLGGYGNNILVQGNELASNGFWSGIDPMWEAGGFKFADTDNLVARANYSHDNNGAGLWTDISNIHTLYEDNLVVHNTINGISHEISYDAIIRNNTLIGNGYADPRGWGWGSEINIQNSKNVQVYGNRVDMTGGGNGIVLIQQDRGSGTYGTYTTTGNQIHDNIIVDRDGHGYIGAFADYNESGMLNGGNTWTNNQYFMSDGGDRFEWGGSQTFTQFKAATHETGSISLSYPDTSSWLTTSPTAPIPTPPVDPAPLPPVDPAPVPPVVVTTPPGVTTTIGSGSDVLELKITQDAYQGDSQYAVSVDGKQIGSTLTASALHGSGVVDTVQVKGDWAAGSHTVSVQLLNDLYGGTATTDRNIYIESATYDGANASGSRAITSDTPETFTVTDTTAVPGSPTPTPTPAPTPSGQNLLVNGSFEAPSVAAGSWAAFSSIPGWTAISGGTIELWNNLNKVKATDGSNLGALDYRGAQDGLYQTVTTTAGQSYDLSFDARMQSNAGKRTSTIEVLWNDNVVATVPPGSSWTTYHFSVTGTGGQDRLTFREVAAQAGDGRGALYDNVSLVARSGAVQQSAISQQPMNLVNQFAATSFADTGSGISAGSTQTDLSATLAQTLAKAHH
ncbi:right-handed parallel beta-helix repeat-containing protein [Bradyrhizobium sp. Arg68]|uniref:carbohydrate-binding domain-containing protein n=1 Tax=Bradyrhizobium ivorense TaxID=2511166 RepID=UPI001E4D47EA|nr:carbohydrate-binding domain-containing protein [Bradyrhizobium ivorense]MCC8936851.1 right-handed parallel beta-helix repeat-containing protein [Bradyrhizobium ivorense]